MHGEGLGGIDGGEGGGGSMLGLMERVVDLDEMKRIFGNEH